MHFKAFKSLVFTRRLNTHCIDADRHDEILHFCKDYLDSTKSYVREIIINGLDAVTKKERVRHILQEAYVPLTPIKSRVVVDK